MNNKIVASLGLCLALSACSQESITPTPPHSDPQAKVANVKPVTKKAPLAETISNPILSKSQAKARIAAGAVVFDARSAAEFATGHAPTAINVPYELLEPTLPALVDYKKKEILVVGKNTQQVEAMRKAMKKAGFTTVLNALSLNS